jgi:2-iminobutanoate/2-iminopropanoate deaminase
MADERRQKSIEVEGLGHGAPIPMGCRVGPILMTSGVGGKDRKTGKTPEDADGQARNAFDNLKAVLAAADLGLGDVVKITVYVVDDKYRNEINKYWEECYPDPHKRPARHSLVMPLRGVLLQLEAFAVAKGA